MTETNQEILQRAAALARMALSPTEAAQLAPEFSAILGAFEVLSQLDVDGVPPTLGVTNLQDVKRADIPSAPASTAALLNNAPDRRGDSFAVPKVIGGDK